MGVDLKAKMSALSIFVFYTPHGASEDQRVIGARVL
jgi:hypothetical protein